MALTILGANIAPPGWQEDGHMDPPVLIELTAKRWKGLLLVSFLLGLFGFFMFGWQMWAEVYSPLLTVGFTLKTSPGLMIGDAFTGAAGVIGMAALFLSLVIGIYARFMAWWRHG